ncbi:hypothetical protein FKR81_11260 [Lentzea tibetensis]|uniref:Uncharacterized protein n=1 Tax=Lentzea tibetensis TaxID=2591470 RepID=A0A563EXE8_9PSEU|nr:hypothetical protein [Lentzea tibetensis]TWP52151.1 hypothetical protein FKR81_11260 [Lentzea tibetensis]
MTKTISKIGDKVLGLLLNKSDAGACRVCPGPCGEVPAERVCYQGREYQLYCRGIYTCDCGCVPDRSQPCRGVPTGRSC